MNCVVEIVVKLVPPLISTAVSTKCELAPQSMVLKVPETTVPVPI
jgi:hypothetical protein